MRILAIADIHGSAESLAAFAPLAREADLLLLAGDLTDFGGENEAEALLEILGPFKDRLLMVPGNCDRLGAREAMARSGASIDGQAARVGGALVAGVGGGSRHNGVTPYERRDEELAAALEAGLKSARGRGPERGLGPDAADLPLVVLTHQPPRGSGADDRKGSPVGSPALRALLDRLTPVLWVCGHIHESPCAKALGRTLVLNPGPLREGRYAEVRLEKDSGSSWRASAELKSL
jgi:Predicted phosphoesterases, related to the Icc protein